MKLHEEYEDTPFKWYRPDEVDEYIVVVNLPEDWEEVHNYIINENEIDGIPNRNFGLTKISYPNILLKSQVVIIKAVDKKTFLS